MRIALALSAALLPFIAQAQTTPPTCSAASLSGAYHLTLTGRNLNSSSALNAAYQAVGTATFDGAGGVTFSLTSNNSHLQGVSQSLSGTYILTSNCTGTLTIATGDSATYTLITWNGGKNFTITGQDATYALSGSGGQQTASCGSNANSLLSGTYALSGTGYVTSSGGITGVNGIVGQLQFTGRGTFAGNWNIVTNGASTPAGVSGDYTVNASCEATSTIVDSAGTSWTLTFLVTSTDGSSFAVDIANTQMQFAASGHSTFTAAGAAVVNAASSAASGTPPGSIFALYGVNLAPSVTSATEVPLPDGLAGTSVTVNGESAPLFFVSGSQVNAQMPWDIKPGLASVVVTTSTATSNTAAVTVPSAAVPGIFVQYPGSQAVVANSDNSLNTSITPAHVGDEVVAYFTGGGPVTPSGPLVTGDYSPATGPSPIAGSTNPMVTVGGVQATVDYVGLTADLVGVYQVNFVIPAVSPGNRDLVLTIGGQASATTTISVAQ